MWSNSLGLKIFQPNIFERRSNFEGTPLVDVYLPYPPFIIENSAGVLNGVSIEIVQKLQRALDFSTVHKKPSDDLWTGRNDNGKHRHFRAEAKETVFLSCLFQKTYFLVL